MTVVGVAYRSLHQVNRLAYTFKKFDEFVMLKVLLESCCVNLGRRHRAQKSSPIETPSMK